MDRCTANRLPILINYSPVKANRNLPIRFFVALTPCPPSLHCLFPRLISQRNLCNFRNGLNRRGGDIVCAWTSHCAFLVRIRAVTADKRESQHDKNASFSLRSVRKEVVVVQCRIIKMIRFCNLSRFAPNWFEMASQDLEKEPMLFQFVRRNRQY